MSIQTSIGSLHHIEVGPFKVGIYSKILLSDIVSKILINSCISFKIHRSNIRVSHKVMISIILTA